MCEHMCENGTSPAFQTVQTRIYSDMKVKVKVLPVTFSILSMYM